MMSFIFDELRSSDIRIYIELRKRFYTILMH